VKVARSTSTTGYAGSNGTSFSCPLTAGVAALVLQVHPFYSVEQVISVMRETARNASSPDNLVGWGIVDALAAVRAPAP
jgi:serine protease AprX